MALCMQQGALPHAIQTNCKTATGLAIALGILLLGPTPAIGAVLSLELVGTLLLQARARLGVFVADTILPLPDTWADAAGNLRAIGGDACGLKLVQRGWDWINCSTLAPLRYCLTGGDKPQACKA
jgi:hypothetical protein